MTKVKTPTAEPIYIDKTSFDRFDKLENEAKEKLNDLRNIFIDVTGLKNINYTKLIDDTAEYVLTSWWKTAKAFYPENANKQKAYDSQSDIEINTIESMANNFKAICKELRQYAPEIKANAVYFKVDKKLFEYYLDPSKKDHYNALKSFLNSAKELKKYEPHNMELELVRFSSNIIWQGINATIQKQNFIKR